MPCISIPVQPGRSPSTQIHVAKSGTLHSMLERAAVSQAENLESIGKRYSESHIEVLALLDSGAECSGISPTLAKKLKLQSKGMRSIRGVHGAVSDCAAYEIEVLLGQGFTPVQLEVAAFECGYEIVLGMDFLTKGLFFLDWRNQCTLCL